MCRRMCKVVCFVPVVVQCDEQPLVILARRNPDSRACKVGRYLIETVRRYALLRAFEPPR